MRFYEPLPLGTNAFMAPLAPAAEPSSWTLRKVAVWCVLGALAGASAGGIVLAFALERGTGADEAHRVAVQAEAKDSTATAVQDEPAHKPPRALAALPEPPASAQDEAAAPADVAPVAQTPAEDAAPEAPAAPAVAGAASDPPANAKHASRRGEARAEPAIDKPSRAQVLAAMARVQPAVRACLPGGHGMVSADVTIIGRTGRVSSAQISGQVGNVGSCVARAMRKAKFPKFTSESISIRYPMSL